MAFMAGRRPMQSMTASIRNKVSQVIGRHQAHARIPRRLLVSALERGRAARGIGVGGRVTVMLSVSSMVANGTVVVSDMYQRSADIFLGCVGRPFNSCPHMRVLTMMNTTGLAHCQPCVVSSHLEVTGASVYLGKITGSESADVQLSVNRATCQAHDVEFAVQLGSLSFSLRRFPSWSATSLIPHRGSRLPSVSCVSAQR
jgi:hypothetical protein